MRLCARLLVAAAAAALALAPALAEARPGGGASSGSRGSRTFQAPPPTQTAPGPARPMDRTMSEPSRPAAPVSAPAPATPRPAAGAPAAHRSFGAAMMAGLFGAGLFGLLLGAGMFGGLGSLAGVLGLLLQIALIGGLLWLILALLRRRAPEAATPALARRMAPHPGPIPGLGPAAFALSRGTAEPEARPVAIGADDLAAFEAALIEINRAWSTQDLPALRRLATPEMLRYFEEDYAALAARGWRNETRDVRLEQGDVAEAWAEGAREYCTVAMRFSLIDVTRRLSDGAVVEGDPTRRQEVTELWTFQRVQGGPWLLSAIQQTG